MTEMDRSNQQSININKRIGNLGLAAVNLYLTLIPLYWVLKVIVGDKFWPVAVVSFFLHWLLLPSFILLPFFIWKKRWIPVAVLASNVIFFLWLFGTLFFPNPSSSKKSHSIVIMTHNAPWHVVALEDFSNMLLSSEADIIALQELGFDQIELLEDQFSDLYPYQALHGDYGPRGMGILSKYPIVDEELLNLQSIIFTHQRVIISVDIPGEKPVNIEIINAHLPPPNLIQGIHPMVTQELYLLVENIPNEIPGILLGDFNQTDQNDNYKILVEAGLKDAYRNAGWGFGGTWPASGLGVIRNLIRIDFIWHTEYFQAFRSWVGPSGGSDHASLYAELVLVDN